jgi:Flp pilus assembly protein CpaB
MEKVKKRNSGTLFLVGAIVFALAAAYLSAVMIRSYTETKDVVAVVRDVKAFEKLDQSDLALVTVPTASVPADAVTRAEDVAGQYVEIGLLKETILRQGHISGVGGSSLAAKLTYSEASLMRAFALPYDNAITFGGKIEEEDRIDIVGAISLEHGGIAAKIIAQNVRVLDVITGEQAAVIIALKPEAVEELVFLLENGKVYASLNPYGADTGAASTPGVYNVDTFMNRHIRQEVIRVPEIVVGEEVD